MTVQPPQRRVDASMDVLNDIVRHPVDPDYAVVAARADRPRPRGWLVAVVTLAAGLMVGISLAGALVQAPQVQNERADLIARVQAGSARVSELEGTKAELEDGNAALTGADATPDPSAAAALSRLEVVSGTVAVRGPGVVIVADDGTSDAAGAELVDADLRQLVNQLWRSGAEAVAVNGHRVTSRTAIRSAGEAITVNYRSLTRPYRVEAIGDTDAMVSQFPSSPGGQWWAYLRQNYGVDFELTTSEDLVLPADAGLGVNETKR